MFWRKKEKDSSQEKLPRPKGIPDAVGRYLVVNMGRDPNWVWNLKAALRPKAGEADSFDFRVFDGIKAANQKVAVKNYNTLTEHPELILFEGTFNKKTYQVSLQESQKPAT